MINTEDNLNDCARVVNEQPIKCAIANARVCFLGSARYSEPLNSTDEKKFRLLAGPREIFVIGFSSDIKFRRFNQQANFLLFPLLPWPLARQVMTFTTWPIFVLWLVLRHNVKLIVCQSPYEGLVGALIKKMLMPLGYKIKLIIESHGDFEQALFLQRKVYCKWLYKLIMNHAARIALHEADLLRAISDSTRKQLESWSSNKTIFQYPAWTDIDTFFEASQVQCDEERKSILYAGVLTPLKGVDILMRAFHAIASDFTDYQLIIAGRAENWQYARSLKILADDLGLTNRVSFVGEVSQQVLARLMRQAALLVLPSLTEGFGRVIIEAMAVGTPVIASSVGGVAEIIKDGENGLLFPTGNKMALSDRLRAALLDPQLLKIIADNAKEQVSGIFSTDAYVRNYNQLFTKAML